MNRIRALPILMVAALMPFSAGAHSPYLLPNEFDVSNRDHVTVLGSFAEQFFKPDVVMKSDDYHVMVPDGSKVPLKPVYTRDLAIIEADTKVPGTYRISTGQRTGRTAKAKWVDGDWVFLAPDKAAAETAKLYDVTSVTVAETYVSRGKPDEKALAARHSGLEFHAISHPSSLFVGSNVTFDVLFDGKPLANQVISVYRDHAGDSTQQALAELRTDGAGRFSFKPDAQGIYLAMTRYRPTPAADSQKGVSYTYSAVLEVTD